VRFLRVHLLRGADPLQLAAASMAAERRPSSLEVVTLDDRLTAAARKEDSCCPRCGRRFDLHRPGLID
jgi:hypothetical protein